MRYFPALSMAMIAAALVATAPAQAASLIVSDIDSPAPDGDSWGKLDQFNTGTAKITTAAPRLGNGSIELTGDQTRVQLGNQLNPGATNLGLASAVSGLTFDWRVGSDSTNANYTPSLRLLVRDSEQLSVFVWSGRNNGVNTNPTDSWYSSSVSDLFWQWTYKGGNTLDSSSNFVLMTLSDWVGALASDAFVTAISVGAGRDAGVGYHGFVDNVQLFQQGQLASAYNFEATAPVPEPATWLMLMFGFAAIGAMMRRKPRQRVTFAI